MALSATVLNRTRHSIKYRLTEAGTAAAVLALDVPADLASGASEDGPLHDLFKPQYASQATARTALHANCDVKVYPESVSATDPQNLSLDPDISGGTPANFELNALSTKGGDTDEAVWIVEISLKHSLVK